MPGGVDQSGTHRVIPAFLWLIQRLAQRHDIDVIALRQESFPLHYRLLGANVNNIGKRPRRVLAVRTILKRHRAGPFDLLHAFWNGATSHAALLAGRLCRCPVLIHLAGGELVWLPDIGYGGLRDPLRRFAARAVLKSANRVTAASGPMLALASSHGVVPLRVTLGVDLLHWPVRPPRPRVPGQPARLVHVASLNRAKDQGTLLLASQLLARAGVAFHLDVIGEDTLGGQIQRMASSLDLLNRVTFHGFQPQPHVYSLVAAADLMVIASRHEAGPVAVLEAAAVGVPTVGTDVGHLHDMAPKAAVTVKVGDANALAHGIAAVLEDDARRLSLASAAQDIALREDADWTARKFESIYDELISASA